MAKNVLITGGAGFVGSHLADALLEAGHKVRVFDSLSPQVHPHGMPEYLNRAVEFMRGDMRDHAAVERAVSGVDVIFHEAAAVGVGQSMYEIESYVASNTQGTAVLLQVLLDRKIPVEKLVVASSMSIYGEGSYRCGKCSEEAPELRKVEQLKAKHWEVVCSRCGSDLNPIPTREEKPLQAPSFYALTKKDQEEMCLLFGRTYGLAVVALRYFNIYGTRQALSNPYTGVAAIFASQLLNDRAPMIFEDGGQMRDFVSVHDVVQANLLAMEESGADGRAVNIGSGSPVTISDVAGALNRSLGKSLASDVKGQYRAGDIRHCFADISVAKKLLGYKPRYAFQEGVLELAQWLR
ncbi:MAG: NAD-dependent epimerase/dehydratase family protein, partial [Acidobacteriaceae bacterium]